MFSESALIHIAICLTALALFARGLASNRLAASRKLSWRLRGKRRRLAHMCKHSRSQRVKLQRKKEALTMQRAVLEKQLQAIEWAGVARWADASELPAKGPLAELAAASA